MRRLNLQLPPAPNMDKETNTPDEVLGSAEESNVTSKTSNDTKAHEFNEQTNYVPKRTIITVWCSYPVAHYLKHERKRAQTDHGRYSSPARASTFWHS